MAGISCQSQFSWMENSMQQTPCLVAAWLIGICVSPSSEFNGSSVICVRAAQPTFCAFSSSWLGPADEYHSKLPSAKCIECYHLLLVSRNLCTSCVSCIWLERSTWPIYSSWAVYNSLMACTICQGFPLIKYVHASCGSSRTSIAEHVSTVLMHGRHGPQTVDYRGCHLLHR